MTDWPTWSNTRESATVDPWARDEAQSREYWGLPEWSGRDYRAEEFPVRRIERPERPDERVARGLGDARDWQLSQRQPAPAAQLPRPDWENGTVSSHCADIFKVSLDELGGRSGAWSGIPSEAQDRTWDKAPARQQDWRPDDQWAATGKECYRAEDDAHDSAFADAKADGALLEVMLKNLPNRAKPERVKGHIIDLGFTCEKLYMPMDHKTGVNRGYAFVRFADEHTAIAFIRKVEKTQLPASSSKKMLTASFAVQQTALRNRDLHPARDPP